MFGDINMIYIWNNLKKGIQFALGIVLLSEIILEIWYQSKGTYHEWRMVRLLVGSFLVSCGYSLSSGIYLIKQISTWIKIGVQLLSGTASFVLAGFLCGWFRYDNTGYNVLLVIGQLFIAIVYLVIDYIYHVKLAEDIKKHLKRVS